MNHPLSQVTDALIWWRSLTEDEKRLQYDHSNFNGRYTFESFRGNGDCITTHYLHKARPFTVRVDEFKTIMRRALNCADPQTLPLWAMKLSDTIESEAFEPITIEIVK